MDGGTSYLGLPQGRARDVSKGAHWEQTPGSRERETPQEEEKSTPACAADAHCCRGPILSVRLSHLKDQRGRVTHHLPPHLADSDPHSVTSAPGGPACAPSEPTVQGNVEHLPKPSWNQTWPRWGQEGSAEAVGPEQPWAAAGMSWASLCGQACCLARAEALVDGPNVLTQWAPRGGPGAGRSPIWLLLCRRK